jgi:hypothetical protein
MKQECKDCNKSLEDCTCIEDTIELPNQALIDAAKNHSNQTIRDDSEKSFIEGAKWQQERSYSEEDVKNAFLDGWQLRDGDLPFPKAKKEWFEQFKKK